MVDEIRSFFAQVDPGPQYEVAFGPDLTTATVYNRHNGIEARTGRLEGGRWKMEAGSFGRAVLGDVIRFRRKGGRIEFVG